MSFRGLTLKQKRFVRAYVQYGNATRAALEAYDTDDPRTAHAIAAENLRKPAIHRAAADLLYAHGLSRERLLGILAHYLDLHREKDVRLKALALKALDMALKLTGAYQGHDAKLAGPDEPVPASPTTDAEMTALLEVSERILAGVRPAQDAVMGGAPVATRNPAKDEGPPHL